MIINESKKDKVLNSLNEYDHMDRATEKLYYKVLNTLDRSRIDIVEIATMSGGYIKVASKDFDKAIEIARRIDPDSKIDVIKDI